MIDGRAGEELARQRNAFPVNRHAAQGLLGPAHVQRRGLRRAKAQNDATAGERAQRARFHGQEPGMSGIGRDDPKTDRDPLGKGGGGRRNRRGTGRLT